MERIREYSLIFKEGTDLHKKYDGEFISENKEEVDYLFENDIEQVKEYYAKEWVRENKDEDWEEDDFEIYYSIAIIEEKERKALAQQLYDCYILDTEDENCITVIDAFKKECTTNIYTDEKTRKEMVELLEKEFENNDYEISKNNGFYYYDGKLQQVEPDFDFVAVKSEKTKEV